MKSEMYLVRSLMISIALYRNMWHVRCLLNVLLKHFVNKQRLHPQSSSSFRETLHNIQEKGLFAGKAEPLRRIDVESRHLGLLTNKNKVKIIFVHRFEPLLRPMLWKTEEGNDLIIDGLIKNWKSHSLIQDLKKWEKDCCIFSKRSVGVGCCKIHKHLHP